MTFALPTFTAGLVMTLSLSMAIGPLNAHVLRVGLQRQHLWLTVAVCALADMALIALGVLGLSGLGALSDKLHGALIGAGALFLAGCGWQAFQRFRRPSPDSLAQGESAGAPAALTRRQAVMSALAFSWLNPHAWIDTAVLIGSASLAYSHGRAAFGMGAVAGSLLWFLVLGSAAFWLGRRLNSLHVWRMLDGVVALMMWGMAGWLLSSLV